MKKIIAFVFSLCILLNVSPLWAVKLSEILTEEDMLQYKGYVVRKFERKQGFGWNVLVEKEGRPLAIFTRGGQHPDMSRFGLFSFLGENTKELLIEQYSGGAHCCWFYWIYRLVPNFDAVYESWKYEKVGGPLDPVDANNDGVYEFTQRIYTFDYFDRLSHAYSPFPKIIFAYDREKGEYLPANHIYPDYILEEVWDNITKVRQLNARISPATYEDKRGEYLSLVLKVLTTFIYAGYEKLGWFFFESEYRLPDKEIIKLKIEERLKKCSVYRYMYVGYGSRK